MLWFFVRQKQRLQCELRPAGLRDGFELIWTSGDGNTRVEHGQDFTVLNEQRLAWESKLRADGWTRLGRVTPPRSMRRPHQTPPVVTPPNTATTMRTVDEPRPCTVLLVEDVQVTRDLLEQYFTSRGCRVLQATNPHTAWNYVTTTSVDVVLLDLHLEHGCSGLEVLELMRIERRFASTPVIVLTGVTPIPEDAQEVITRCGATLLSKSDGYAVIAEKLESLMNTLAPRFVSRKTAVPLKPPVA